MRARVSVYSLALFSAVEHVNMEKRYRNKIIIIIIIIIKVREACTTEVAS